MTLPFTKPVKVLLLDIEGTTTPIDFVYNILFPYARRHVKAYLDEHARAADLQADIHGLLDENSDDGRRGLNPPPIDPARQVLTDQLAAYVYGLRDRDRKSTPLKSLQGKIWEAGYKTGDLRSQVFKDVPTAFKRWREQARFVCIYSSGSVLAQKLLFAHTEAGNLTGFIRDYFDTNIGAKQDAGSYLRIAAQLERQPPEIVFVSDRIVELDAAASAGLEVILCVRPGNDPESSPFNRDVVYSFDVILP